MIPGESRPIAPGTTYAGTLLARASPWIRRDLVLSTGTDATTGEQLPPAQWSGFYARDIVCAAIEYYGTVGASTYDFIWENELDTTLTTIEQGKTTKLPIAWLSWALGLKPHDNTLYPGRTVLDQQLNFFWMDSEGGGSTIALTFTAIAASSTAVFTLWKYAHGNIVQVGEFTAAATNTTLDIPLTGSGYYALDCRPTLTDVTNVTGRLVMADTTFWGHHTLPGFIDNVGSMKSYMLTAVSALITNGSAVLSLNGFAAGVQLPKKTLWQNNFTYDAISGMQGADRWTANKGAYGYIKYVDANDEVMQSNFNTEDGVLQNAWFMLDGPNVASRIAISLSIPNPEGRTLNMQFDTHLFFQTTDPFFQVSVPRTPKKSWEDGVLAASTARQFYDNPDHMKQISSFLKRTLKSAWPTIVKHGVPFLEKAISAL
jgi:hypothetical protein